MRQVVFAAVALLACLASASHLETVFSVSMPYSETNSSSAYLFGDAVYVICGPYGAVVEAINLTTRTNMWTSPNYTSSYGEVTGLVATSQAVLLGFPNAIVALSTSAGQQLWSQTGYQLQLPAAAFTYGNAIYAQVVLPTGFYALQAFDLTTGATGYFQYGNDLQIDGTTAFVAQYGLNGNMITNSFLRAVDIPTNTTLWVVPCADQAPQGLIQAVSSEYVVISNQSGSDEIAVVLHRKNGSLVQAFQAFNGFTQNAQPSLRGNKLIAAVGMTYPRYVVADLTTGYITWTRTVAEVGAQGLMVGDFLVSIPIFWWEPCWLDITRVESNQPSVSVFDVPCAPPFSIADLGSGAFLVPNLQGYTLWDASTAKAVGRNEQDPAFALSALLKWNGLTVIVGDGVLRAMKLAQ